MKAYSSVFRVCFTTFKTWFYLTCLVSVMGHNIHAFFGFVITVNEQKGSVEDFMYDADIDGSTLLHLAANSGVLKVIPCQAMNPQT